MRVCSLEGCDRRHKAKGLCPGHYRQLLKGQEFSTLREIPDETPLCGFEGCERVSRRNGLCPGHYTQAEKGRELTPIEGVRYQPKCSFDGCEKPFLARELCAGHYQQSRQGKELTPLKKRIRYGPQCSFDGCDKPHLNAGFCAGHYEQKRKGKTLRPLGWKRSTQELLEQAARGMRQCNKCTTELPLSEEYFYRPRGEWSPTCKRCRRDIGLRERYGISADSWDVIFEAQGKRCAICLEDEPGGRGHWVTDHDHSCCLSGKTCGKCVRAILCNNCNITVGYIETHPDIAQALAYIEFHSMKMSAKKAG